MDWESIVLDWANSLRLTETPINTIQELGDGSFLCEILELLFEKTVDNRNRAQVFQVLKESLENHYTPKDWINYEDAYDSNVEELVKIISVIIGIGSLQSEEKIFLENPSNYLDIGTQIKVTEFLESVLSNSKIVDGRFINFSEDNDDENKENFPNKNTVLSSPVLEPDRLLMSEKINEISTLNSRIKVLTFGQRDLMDEINSYKEENGKLLSSVEELKRQSQSFRLMANLNNSHQGSPCPTPDSVKENETNLRERLKRSENYVERLENNIDESNGKIRDLEKELENFKNCFNQAALRESELLKEIEENEKEKVNLVSVVDLNNEIVRKLEQELEDFKDFQRHQQPSYEHGTALNGIMDQSICESTDTTAPSKSDVFSQCEDMSFVVEVQLGETQELLQKTEENRVMLEVRLREKDDQIFALKKHLEETVKVKEEEIEDLKSNFEANFLKKNQEITPMKSQGEVRCLPELRITLVVLVFFFFMYFLLPRELLTFIIEFLFGRLGKFAEKHGKLIHKRPPCI